MNSKSEWRREFQKKLNLLSSEEIQNKSDKLVMSLKIFFEDHSLGGTWTGFCAYGTEPRLSNLWGSSLACSKQLQWAFPKVVGEQLEFYVSEKFQKGAFGILEPSTDLPPVEISNCRGFLIPGLGFSLSGERLGKGKGFYDRALENAQGFKMGVCFEEQLVSELGAQDPHDVKMDAIVTDQRIIIFSEELLNNESSQKLNAKL